MAGFDLFSQPQGPAISISLFGDAAKTGAQLGKEIPSYATAAVEGAQKGYQLGQQFEANNQVAEIRQNQIDNFDTANDFDKERLKAIKLQNEGKGVDTRIAVATEQSTLATTQAQLQGKQAEAQVVTEFANQKQDFVTNFPTWDTGKQAMALASGQYQGAFEGKEGTDLYNQYAQKVISNPNFKNVPNSDAIRNQLISGIATKTAAQQAQDYKDDAKYNQALGFLGTSSGYDEAYRKTGLTQEQLFANSELVAPGDYEVKDGELVPDNGNNTYKRGIIAAQADSNHPRMDLLYTDPATGKRRLVAQGIDANKDFTDALAFTRGQQKYRDNSWQRSQEQQIYKSLGGTTPTPTEGTQKVETLSSTSTPTSGTPTSSTPEPKRPVYFEKARQVLGTSADLTENLSPTLEKLFNHSVAQVNNPSLRSSPASLLEQADLVRNVTRAISDNEFDSNLSLSSTYTPGYVEEYNRGILQSARNTLGSLVSTGMFSGASNLFDDTYAESIAAPAIAKTPKDVYYAKQSGRLNGQVDSLLNEYRNITSTGARKKQGMQQIQNMVGKR